MHQAILYDKLPGSITGCRICQWRCRILPGKYGVCRMYHNTGGVLYNLNYASVSSMAVDPIEKKPLFHLAPGSRCFSLGGWGCNFHCAGCQNWEIACLDDTAALAGSRRLEPDEAVKMALEYDCQGIAWTYNEPSIWFEYTLDSARLAREAGLYTVYVTNGYLSAEALDKIGPNLSAWRVDVKGFSDESYKKQARIPHWRGILEVARRAREKWDMHVEVVTNLIPGINDDEQQMRGIAAWIAAELGPLIPWHVTRFHPDRNLPDIPVTPVARLERAIQIGTEEGLKFIYAGNLPGHPSENTICYNCGNLAVKRVGYNTQVTGLCGSACSNCGAELNIRLSGGDR
jgi:pyruvate formate lyase activating enzyme